MEKKQQKPGDIPACYYGPFDLVYSLDLVGGTVLEYKQLLLFECMLGDIQSQLDDWRSALFKFNSDLVNMNAEMGAFSRDSVICQLITDSIHRQMYLDELSQLREKWEKARDSTWAHDLKKVFWGIFYSIIGRITCTWC